MKACIIGAGPTGIAAAKHLRQVGITDLVVYEKNNQVGGNWVFDPRPGHSSVFTTTHIISSRSMSQYYDYPLPEHYPDYPSHDQLREYFQGYARHFDIEPFIRFNTEVQKIERIANGNWQVTLADESKEEFEHLLVCNGHHWDPRIPEYPGEFTGQWMHSHDFKSNAGFENKRVLVIGGGNSACDIAVETGRVSSQTGISMRRGYYFIPKFMLGKPVDTINSGVTFIPKRLRNWLMTLLLGMVVGRNEQYGLQKPDHKLLETHPVVNSELLYFIRHGKIKPHVDIDHFEGQTVHFKDGSTADYDVVITATGYKISHPFFDKNMLDYSNGDVPLFRHVFHPEYDNLYFLGLVQPAGCIWPLADRQAQLVANYITGTYQLPADMMASIKQDIHKIRDRYLHTPRHSVQVDFHEYLHELENEIPAQAPEWQERKQMAERV